MRDIKRIKGSLTIEAAIILPLFLLGMMTVLNLVKLMYIHEEIQHAITCIGEDISANAYIYEVSNINELQQKIYNSGDDGCSGLFDSVDKIEKNYDILQESVSEIPEIKVKINKLDFKKVSAGKSNDLIIRVYETIQEVVELKAEIESLLKGSYEAYTTIVDEARLIISNSPKYMMSLGTREAILRLNNMVTGSMIKTGVKEHLSHKQCEKYGIVGGLDGIRFTDSNICVKDDDILIVASYRVKFLLLDQLIDGIKIRQSVKIRGFVGNGNFKDQYKKKKEDKKQKDEIVYVTRNGSVYHTNRFCYHIKDTVVAVRYGAIKGIKRPCEVCGNDMQLTDDTIVYTTLKSDIFHINRGCYTINTSCYAMTKEEAIAAGYTECKTCRKRHCSD